MKGRWCENLISATDAARCGCGRENEIKRASARVGNAETRCGSAASNSPALLRRRCARRSHRCSYLNSPVREIARLPRGESRCAGYRSSDFSARVSPALPASSFYRICRFVEGVRFCRGCAPNGLITVALGSTTWRPFARDGKLRYASEASCRIGGRSLAPATERVLRDTGRAARRRMENRRCGTMVEPAATRAAAYLRRTFRAETARKRSALNCADVA